MTLLLACQWGFRPVVSHLTAPHYYSAIMNSLKLCGSIISWRKCDFKCSSVHRLNAGCEVWHHTPWMRRQSDAGHHAHTLIHTFTPRHALKVTGNRRTQRIPTWTLHTDSNLYALSNPGAIVCGSNTTDGATGPINANSYDMQLTVTA